MRYSPNGYHVAIINGVLKDYLITWENVHVTKSNEKIGI